MTVVKVVELVGDSKESWQDAIQKAVSEAAKTIHGITGIEVLNMTANVDAGQITEYKADVQIAFEVDNR